MTAAAGQGGAAHPKEPANPGRVAGSSVTTLLLPLPLLLLLLLDDGSETTRRPAASTVTVTAAAWHAASQMSAVGGRPWQAHTPRDADHAPAPDEHCDAQSGAPHAPLALRTVPVAQYACCTGWQSCGPSASDCPLPSPSTNA